MQEPGAGGRIFYNVTPYIIIALMRLQKLFAFGALAALPLLAAARPATPELLRHVNPDGSVVEYRLHGNEHFSYITDAEGVSILEYNGGRLEQAFRNGTALRAVDSDIELLRAEAPEPFKVDTKVTNRMPPLVQAGPDKGRTTYNTVGEVPSCVILLEFPDVPFSSANPVDQFDRLCNEEGYSDFRNRGSARDYYMACSNGKFQPHFDVYGPVKLEHPSAWYTNQIDVDSRYPSNDKSARWGKALYEAITALDKDVDFSKYDCDNDGVIDNIFFFYSGYGQADGGGVTTIWPHQSDYLRFTAKYGWPLGLPDLNPDGVSFRTYACANELNNSSAIPASERPFVDGIGSFCHEYGHVLGLPDLYDTGYNGCKTPGRFSVMDQGSYNELSTCPPLFSAYEQWLCRWLEYTDAEDGETYQLNPLCDSDRNAVRLRIRMPGSAGGYQTEYYVIESRGPESWDYSVPEHGVLIWRINYNNSIWADNKVNSGSTPYVELIESSIDETAWPGEWEDYTYITPQMKVFVPICNSRRPLDVTISNITYDYATGDASIEYNKYKPLEEAPVMSEYPVRSEESREFTLRWTGLPDAQSYCLTVSREDNNGNSFYVDNLNETNVGNVTEYTVRNITANQWTQKFSASVRGFAGVPGAVISNVVNFVPAELPTSGVDGVEVDVPVIMGGQGCIVAPEGAKVFNLSGVECGTENLPAGVYLVVTTGATAKVQVR